MARMTAAVFLETIEEMQLLDAEQLAELRASPAAESGDLQALAKHVHQKRWLTRFQITQLAQGKGKELQLGPYRLLDQLGEGGMGQVFKAQHKTMERIVALKVIRKERLANPDSVRRFHQEVQAAAQLVHPNIVLAYDADQVGTTHYLAMEYVEGIDLSRRVKEGGPLPVAEACEYIRQAALGLQHAHELGLVHRDIKPSNLLVTHSQEKIVVKILDMGLARLEGSANDTSLTREGSVVGTPDYLAPEQAVNSRTVDIRSDLYSLGCTFYCLLAGRSPYRAESLTEMLLKHQLEECPPLEKVRPEVPARVSAVVKKLMAKRPEDRYQTPAELVAALEQLKHPAPSGTLIESGQVAEPESKTPADFEPLPQPKKRSRKRKLPRLVGAAAAGVVFVAFVGAGIALGIHFWPKTEPATEVVRINPGPSTQAGPATAMPKTLPVQLTMSPFGKTVLKAGESQILEVKVSRQGITAPMQVRLSGLPEFVRSEPLPFDFAKNVFPIKLTARADAPDDEATLHILVSAEGKEVAGEALLTIQKREVAQVDPRVKPPPQVIATELRRVEAGHQVLAVGFTRDGRRALSAGRGLNVWDLDTGQAVQRFEKAAGTMWMAIIPGGRQVLTGGGDHAVYVWDLETGQEVRQLTGHATPIMCLAVSPDGRRAVSGSGREEYKDGKLVMAGGKAVFTDCAIRVWDVTTGQEVKQFKGHTSPVVGLVFSRDGRHVLSWERSRRVFLWEAETGQEVREIKDLEPFSCLDVAPDGKHLLVASGNLARLWDLEAGKELRRFEGHNSTIHSIVISQDGKHALTASGHRAGKGAQILPVDCTVRLWAIESGFEIRRFEGHKDAVRSVSFSPDGRWALSGSFDQTLRLWDLGLPGSRVLAKGPDATGKQPVPDAAKQAPALEVIKDVFKKEYAKPGAASRLILANHLTRKAKDTKDDETARFVLLNEAIAQAAEGGDAALAVSTIDLLGLTFAVDPTALKLQALTKAAKTAAGPSQNKFLAESCLAAIDEAMAADYFDAATRLMTVAEAAVKKAQNSQLMSRVDARGKEVQAVQKEFEAYRTAGETLRQSPEDPNAQLIVGKYLCLRKGDWEKGLPMLAAAPESPLQTLAKKDLALASTAPAQVELGDEWWKLADGETSSAKLQMQRRACHWYQLAVLGVTGLTHDRIAKRIKEVLDQAPESEAVKHRKLDGHKARVTSVVFSPDGKRVFSGSQDQTVRSWDVRTGKELATYQGPNTPVRSLAVSADGRRLAASCNNTVIVWEADSKKQLTSTSEGPQDSIDSLAFISREGGRLFYGTSSGSVRYWQWEGKPNSQTLGGRLGAVLSVACSGDGRFGVSSGADGILHLWDLEKKSELPRRLAPVKGEVRSLAVSREGQYLLATAPDNTVRLWDLKTGVPGTRFAGHTAPVTKVVFSADGRLVVTGSEDRTVRVWDARNGRELRVFTGHTDVVTSVAVSPDRNLVASGSADKTIRLWELKGPGLGPK